MAENETETQTVNFKPDPASIELCTRGLVQKFESPVQGIDVSVKDSSQKYHDIINAS